MTDAVTVSRDGELATDPGTGAVTSADTQLYSGKAQIRPETTSEADSQNAGEATDLLDQFLVKVPVSLVDVRTNDTVSVVASSDASLVGARMRVIGVVRGTTVTARRLRCRIDAGGAA